MVQVEGLGFDRASVSDMSQPVGVVHGVGDAQARLQHSTRGSLRFVTACMYPSTVSKVGMVTAFAQANIQGTSHLGEPRHP